MKTKKQLFETLPELFFEDSIKLQQKHFNQWISELLLPCCLASEEGIITNIAK